MAVAAESITTEQTYQETYGHSLSSVRRFGGFVTGAVLDSQERASAEELALVDFKTAVTEMLKTDKEYRQRLDIDNQQAHNVIDDKVCAADGRPMVEILEHSLWAIEKANTANPELEAQVTRDKADLRNGERADRLQPGQTLVVLSFEPKKELKKYKKTYTALGYKEGLSYLQSYTRVDERTLVASSYSVDLSDEATWRTIFAEHGRNIPEETSLNEWVDHGLELEATTEEAEEFVRGMRRDYYSRIGANEERLSVSEYVSENSELIDNFFKVYYTALAEAVSSGNNNEVLQDFARTILSTGVEGLKPEIRQELIIVANSRKFNDELAKTMDSIIRYAVVEELRKNLASFVAPDKKYKPEAKVGAAKLVAYIDQSPGFIHQLLASSLASGVSAGRSYGGCPGQIELAINGLGNNTDHSPQEAYGGKDCVEVKDGQTVRCPHCRKMVKAIVPNRKEIFCSNIKCKLAAPEAHE